MPPPPPPVDNTSGGIAGCHWASLDGPIALAPLGPSPGHPLPQAPPSLFGAAATAWRSPCHTARLAGTWWAPQPSPCCGPPPAARRSPAGGPPQKRPKKDVGGCEQGSCLGTGDCNSVRNKNRPAGNLIRRGSTTTVFFWFGSFFFACLGGFLLMFVFCVFFFSVLRFFEGFLNSTLRPSVGPSWRYGPAPPCWQAPQPTHWPDCGRWREVGGVAAFAHYCMFVGARFMSGRNTQRFTSFDASDENVPKQNVILFKALMKPSITRAPFLFAPSFSPLLSPVFFLNSLPKLCCSCLFGYFSGFEVFWEQCKHLWCKSCLFFHVPDISKVGWFK